MNIIPFLITAIILGCFILVIYHLVKYGFISTGEYGEKIVSNKLAKLDANKYLVINDLSFKTKNGTTQIDHVVVSPYGIFVIETKCYKGLIYGSKDGEYWTQNIYGKKYQLYNPIRQNASHVRVLRNILGEEGKNVAIEPVVVFAGNATLADNLENGQTIYSSKLQNWIYQFTEIKIHNPQHIYDLILSHNIDKEQRVGHVEYVKQVQQQKSEKILYGICPRCGGNLTYREGRYGNFWGCSNYPRCRFTINDR